MRIFNIDVLQLAKEEEVEEPSEIPQNETPIQIWRNDLNDEEPLRYRSI